MSHALHLLTSLLVAALLAAPAALASDENRCQVVDGASTCPYGNSAGTEIKKGIFLDITKSGFDTFTDLARVFVPETVPIDTSGLSQGGSIGGALLGASYSVEISNVVVAPELRQLLITPRQPKPARAPDLYKNGQLDVEARLTADVNSRNDPARVRVRVSVQLLFFDISLLNQQCLFWVDRNTLGVIGATVPLSVGPKKNFNGQTGRGCRGLEVCAETRPGSLCDTPCIEIDPNAPMDVNCSYEVPLDCPFPFDPRDPDVDPRCFFVQGDPICYTEEQLFDPPDPTLCFEAELPYFVQPPRVRDCNGYIEPWIDSPGVRLNIEDLPESAFDFLERDCDGFLGFLVSIAQNLLGGVADIGPIFASIVEPAIADVLADTLPDIQESLARALWLEEAIDVLGSDLNIAVGPGDLYVNDRGLRLELWSKIGAARSQPAACVSSYIGVGQDGSRSTIPATRPPGVQTFPELGQAFAGANVPAQITALIDDDVFNQALFGVWRDGVLCQTLDATSLPFDLPAGIQLDTALLRAFAQGELDELFPEAGPLIFKTRPRKPPTFEVLETPDGAEAGIDLEEFGLDIYGELDGRFVRMIGLQLDGDLGASVAPQYDRDTSTLSVELAFDLSNIQPTPLFNDLAPNASEPIASGLGNILRIVAGALLDDLIGEAISFQLPRIFGIGVEDVFFGATGSVPGTLKDYLGVYGTVGFDESAQGGEAGCDLFGDGDGGCDDGGGGCDDGDGCDGGGLGCTTVPARLITLFGVPLLVASLRRRDRRGATARRAG